MVANIRSYKNTVVSVAVILIVVVKSAELDRLIGGEGLVAGTNGDRLTSQGGLYYAVMQNDCNFVIYEDFEDKWSTGTSTYGQNCRLEMKTDGNLVVYDAGGNVRWQTGLHAGSQPGYQLVMQNDGNLVVYDSVNSTLWEPALDRLVGGEELVAGTAVEQLTSPNGVYRAIMHTSCLFVVLEYNEDKWNTGTSGYGSNCRLAMQTDGNLIVYDAGGNVRWQTGLHAGSQPGYQLVLQNDGNLVVYDSVNSALWWPGAIWPIAATHQYCTNRVYISSDYTASQCQDDSIRSGYCGYAHKYLETSIHYCYGCLICDAFTPYQDYSVYVNLNSGIWPTAAAQQYCTNRVWISSSYTAIQCQLEILRLDYCGYDHKFGGNALSDCYGCIVCDIFTPDQNYDVYVNPDRAVWSITKAQHHCTNRAEMPSYTAIQCQDDIRRLGYCGYDHKGGPNAKHYCYACTNCDQFTPFENYEVYVNPQYYQLWPIAGAGQYCPNNVYISNDYTAFQCQHDALRLGYCGYAHKTQDYNRHYCFLCTSCDGLTDISYYNVYVNPDHDSGASDVKRDTTGSFGAADVENAVDSFGTTTNTDVFGTTTNTDVFGGRFRWSVVGVGIGVVLVLVAVKARRRISASNPLRAISGD